MSWEDDNAVDVPDEDDAMDCWETTDMLREHDALVTQHMKQIAELSDRVTALEAKLRRLGGS